jgi:protein ImuB
MKRVASLFLPDWSIDRLRRAGRIAAPPDLGTTAVATLEARGDGWRPGARWARSSHTSPARGGGPRSKSVVEGASQERNVRGSPPPPFAEGANGPPPRAGEELVVTQIREGSKVIIAAASPAARAIGLVPGMAVTQARAQVPSLAIHPADLRGDLAELQRLAIAAARRWSPLTALSGSDGLFLDITGTAHLFGGEARMARRIVRLLARLGFTARIAVADTAGAAWALARYGPAKEGVAICPAGAQEEALARLPIAALRADDKAIELLRRLGVERIGQLAAMPRAPLARRFSAALVARLDQALGRRDEPLDPVIPVEAIVVTQRFAEPIATAEAIQHWLSELMPRLTTALAEAGLGARLVELVADRIDGVPQRLRIGLARPTRDAAHLLRLIVRRIEEIAPGFGIDALALHVRRADPLGAQPFAERLEERSTDLAPLVDALANRIGDRRLWRSGPVESDVPERSAACLPPLDPPVQSSVTLKADDVRQLDRSPDLHPWHHRWPRPVRLLRRPEQLDHVMAELPDQPPRRFSWRGEMHMVVRADGPERVQGEWWKRTAEQHAVRDYFQVENEAGQRFWLFRRGDGERAESGDLSWFMHGAFG